jgi:glycosyltransferase involved in cell wall biosynthesis
MVQSRSAGGPTVEVAEKSRQSSISTSGRRGAAELVAGTGSKPRAGIFDPTGRTLGGGQLVAGYLAALLSRFADVDLIRDWAEYGIGEIASAFSLPLDGVHERRFDASIGFGVPGNFGFLKQVGRSRELTSPYRLFFYCGHGVPPFCHARFGFVYCHFPVEESPLLELERNGDWRQLNGPKRWLKKQAYQLAWRHRMRGYKAVLANSSYTAGWIERRWGVEAQVVYPPVDLVPPRAEKGNVIVSIGRFGGRSQKGKGQTAQVSAFREFLDRGHRDWKLRLIGTCYRPEDYAHLAAVREAARGLPVEFLVNAERSVVLNALAEAKIFWHTAGLLDESGDPYRAEHFGIATVEAMRAGCVPIVIASGGQKEIIHEGIDGFLCKDLQEFIEKTDTASGNESLLVETGQQAKRRSMAFTGEAFDQRVLGIVSCYLGVMES